MHNRGGLQARDGEISGTPAGGPSISKKEKSSCKTPKVLIRSLWLQNVMDEFEKENAPGEGEAGIEARGEGRELHKN